MPTSKKPVHITRVPFRGGFIEAAQLDDEVWVPIRPVCDALGLAWQPQLKKLRAKPWAKICDTFMVSQGDDQRRRFSCVDLRSLPLWLATIEPSRVKPEARPALVAYQREAAEVLYRHFFGERKAAAKKSEEPEVATATIDTGLLSFITEAARYLKYVSISPKRVKISFKDTPAEVDDREPPVVEPASDVAMVPVKEDQTVISATGSFRVQPKVQETDFSATAIRSQLAAQGITVSAATITSAAYALKILGDTAYGRWSSVYLDTGATRWNWRYNDKGLAALTEVLTTEAPNNFRGVSSLKAIGKGTASHASLSHEEYLALQHVAN